MPENTPQPFGDYDREAETEAIRNNPPAAVGDPAGASIADSLESLFTENDDHYVTYPAAAPNGAELLLEFDLDLDGEELSRYQKVAAGNRAARRNGRTQGDTKPWLSAAAMLAEKSTKITHKASGKVYEDASGHPLTLASEEFLAMAKAPGDPVQATLTFFGFPQTVAIGNAYMRDTGIDNEPERVGPTTG